MRRIKVSVDRLIPGMYVAELDRPWTETPFLFQGFYIQGEGEIQALHKTCRYVFVDTEKGYAPPDPDAFRHERGDEPEQPATLFPNAGRDNIPREPDFQRSIPRIRKVRRTTTDFLDKVVDNVRTGERVPVEAATGVVRGLVQSVDLNVNATVWLNNLRRRHRHSADHCSNVAVLSLAFANYLGYEGEELAAIGLGALLHDVGLMRLDTSVLDKPDDLDLSELQEIREHPAQGHRLMERSGQLPAIAMNIIRHHHERISGDGYPDGLKGGQIPKEALVVAIADVYDSLTTDRPYDGPMSPNASLSVIRHSGESSFGPELTRHFMSCIGIYPVSSVVELQNGSIAMVVGHTHKTRVRPEMMLLKDAQGRPYEGWPILNLDRKADEVDGDQWLIMRVVDPDEHDVDIAAVTQQYLDRQYMGA